MTITTLGIHCGHDGGAAIVRDGLVVCAIDEERLTRTKYANGWWTAMRYCLDEAGADLTQVDLIVFSNAGTPLPDGYDGGLSRWGAKGTRVANLDHHLSHAFGAYCTSSFFDAAVVVCDAGGNSQVTESVFAFGAGGYELLSQSRPDRPRAQGIGPCYEALTNFLGFTDQESGKTMALAAYGRRIEANEPVFRIDPASGHVSSRIKYTHQRGMWDLARSAGLDIEEVRGQPAPWCAPGACDLAHFVQSELERAMVELTTYARRATGSDNVVCSGGVALNSVANSRLRRSGGADDYYFFPASSDCGLALGNAMYGQWVLSGVMPRLTNPSMCSGRHYDKGECLSALRREPQTTPPARQRWGDVAYSRSNDIVEETAQRLADGQTVGWFQGGSESGPRALGARSILTLPSDAATTGRLNTLKHREEFRPFGPAVHCDSASALVEGPTTRLRYMIEAPRATQQGAQELAACVHVDGTSRVQVVYPDSAAPRYEALLRRVGELTGTAAVLNTSFNHQEPIVETPGDAVRTFLSLGLDFMALEDFACTIEPW